MQTSKISVAIPTYNSSNFILDALLYIAKDKRISEIIVNDDASPDAHKTEEKIKALNNPKIKFYCNEQNQKAFRNKALAVSKCKEDWIILLDSDNSLSTKYLDKIFQLKWEKDTIYCPSFARPLLNFGSLSEKHISSENIKTLIEKDRNTAALLNDGNYFFNKNSYLKAYERMPFDDFLSILDVMYFSVHWTLEGNKLYVVDGLSYFHRHRNDSFFMENKDHWKEIKQGIMKKLSPNKEISFPESKNYNYLQHKLKAVYNMIIHKIYEHNSSLW